MRNCRLRVLHSQGAPRRRGELNGASQCRQLFDRPCGLPSVNPTRSCATNDPSHQAPPLRSFATHHRSCIDAFPWRDVPLPTPGPSRPGRNEWSFPLLVRRRSWDSQPRSGAALPFAGLLPQRVGDHLWSPGPTCLSSSSRAPIDFRRVDPTACVKDNESRHSGG
jgi:hypothetical protein